MKLTMGRLFAFTLAFFLFASSMPSCKSKPKDEDIQAALTKGLSAVPELSMVTAAVKDGVVTLTGECKDEAGKTNAENIVKAIPGVQSVVNNCTITPPPPPPAPVVIAADDPLSKGVADATKDFPMVKSTVKDGVITLSGEIKKSDLTRLMQSLHTLKPKKIENQLTIK
jgi:hyperosmotically inducible periplasmic protein